MGARVRPDQRGAGPHGARRQAGLRAAARGAGRGYGARAERAPARLDRVGAPDGLAGRRVQHAGGHVETQGRGSGRGARHGGRPGFAYGDGRGEEGGERVEPGFGARPVQPCEPSRARPARRGRRIGGAAAAARVSVGRRPVVGGAAPVGLAARRPRIPCPVRAEARVRERRGPAAPPPVDPVGAHAQGAFQRPEDEGRGRRSERGVQTARPRVRVPTVHAAAPVRGARRDRDAAGEADGERERPDRHAGARSSAWTRNGGRSA